MMRYVIMYLITLFIVSSTVAYVLILIVYTNAEALLLFYRTIKLSLQRVAYCTNLWNAVMTGYILSVVGYQVVSKIR